MKFLCFGEKDGCYKFRGKKRLNVNENENWLETATKDLLAMNISVRTITSLNYSMKVLSEKRFLSHSMQL